MAAIEWHSGSLDAAFALASAQQRPLFLYWGAVWCPPCNRVKSEIFARDEFQARMAQLLPYHLDGDSAGAQALAAHYKLRSYPTLVLFAPDGSEITRLPCELDGELFTAALDNALAVWRAGSSAAQALDAALSGSRALSEGEWTLLSHYSWDTDEGALLGRREFAATLLALVARAAASNASDAAARLGLFAQLATGANGDAAANAAALLSIFSDARVARANMDVLANSGINLIKFATRREELVAALNRVAAGWSEDFWLSAPDRLMALRLQMRLTRLVAASAGLQEQVRSRVEEALAESTDPYERHTLVNTAVSALNDAGLPQLAEQVLQAELPRSHSPYYFMLSLAAAAKRRGDTAGVLSWYEQAAAAAVGPATRIQWRSTYLTSLLDLAPQDATRIERAAEALLSDISATPDAFSQRNLSQLQKLAPKLDANAMGDHACTLLARIRASI
jgi:thiol-disulfide isomerase/thioredoxin